MANCVVPQCAVSRRQQYNGVGIFKFPKASCNAEWRNMLIESVKRFREVDAPLRKRLKDGNIFICERHFRTEDIEFTSKIYKV